MCVRWISRGQAKRILLLGPALTAVSGVSTHLQQLFSSELAQRFVLLYFQVGSEGRNEGMVAAMGRIFLGPVGFFFRLLRSKASIVQLNTSLRPKSYWRDTAFLLVAKLLGRRVVYQVHGGALPEEFVAGHQLARVLLRRVLALPDVVVLLGQVQLAAYQRFLPGQRLVVIPNAVDAEALVQRPLKQVTQGPLHYVYLGRITESKGVFDAVEAVARLVSAGHDFRYTLAGAGADEARLKAHVRALGLEDKVRFAGPLFGEEKNALWCSADVFVFPTYDEKLPYSLLEAMAAGAVPVTTGVGAIPEVLQDGVHGVLVEPKNVEMLAEALADLDGDRTRLLRLARAGRVRVLEHYTVVRLAADFEQLYLSLEG